MKKEKKKFVDEGRTIYSMDGLNGRSRKKANSYTTKNERSAIIKAAFAHYTPILIGIMICFGVVMFLIKFWLN